MTSINACLTVILGCCLLALSCGRPPASQCEPACEGLECGDDGCGGVCGACDDGRWCIEGACYREPKAGEECDPGDELLAFCGGQAFAVACSEGVWHEVACPGGCRADELMPFGVECSLTGSKRGAPCVSHRPLDRVYCGAGEAEIGCAAPAGEAIGTVRSTSIHVEAGNHAGSRGCMRVDACPEDDPRCVPIYHCWNTIDGACEEGMSCVETERCTDGGHCYARTYCAEPESEMPTTWAPDEYAIQCEDGACLVPEGPSLMGCNHTLEGMGCFTNGLENPTRAVSVAAFLIDRVPMTIGQFKECVAEGGCRVHDRMGCWPENLPEDVDDHPIGCLHWHEAKDLCGWTGKRLCTEAEWEKAARGTDGRIYPWGNEPPTCDLAVFNECGGYEGDGCGLGEWWPVGSKPAGASPYGVLDMAGNVTEWVQDNLCSYRDAPTDGSATFRPEYCWSSQIRVMRGGWYGADADMLRASWRWFGSAHPPGTWDSRQNYNAGVRCCRDRP